ncbi:peptidase [Planoprotostelium fungivorum]|uniref:Peptidase n=1 Tax=Planoprotostelium fungivorum TaxID=1890364 RepID=A0A2P6NLD4_9EUKA|nr:peptidase [Planoprotostelium fungivorum]
MLGTTVPPHLNLLLLFRGGYAQTYHHCMAEDILHFDAMTTPHYNCILQILCAHNELGADKALKEMIMGKQTERYTSCITKCGPHSEDLLSKVVETFPDYLHFKNTNKAIQMMNQVLSEPNANTQMITCAADVHRSRSQEQTTFPNREIELYRWALEKDPSNQAATQGILKLLSNPAFTARWKDEKNPPIRNVAAIYLLHTRDLNGLLVQAQAAIMECLKTTVAHHPSLVDVVAAVESTMEASEKVQALKRLMHPVNLAGPYIRSALADLEEVVKKSSLKPKMNVYIGIEKDSDLCIECPLQQITHSSVPVHGLLSFWLAGWLACVILRRAEAPPEKSTSSRSAIDVSLGLKTHILSTILLISTVLIQILSIEGIASMFITIKKRSSIVHTNQFSSGVTVADSSEVTKQTSGGSGVHRIASLRDVRRGAPGISRYCAKNNIVAVSINYRLSRPSTAAICFQLTTLTLIVWLLLFLSPFRGWYQLSAALLTAGTLITILAKKRYSGNAANMRQMVDDVCYSIKYVREHLNELVPGADVNKIYIGGHSAGACITSLIAMDESHLKRHGLISEDEDASKVQWLKGFVLMSGIYSLANPIHNWYWHYANIFFRAMYTSSVAGWDHEDHLRYSPIEYIKERKVTGHTSETPMAGADMLVLSAASDLGLEVDAARFVKKLQSCGYSVTHRVIPKTNHPSIASTFEKNEARNVLLQFIQSVTK